MLRAAYYTSECKEAKLFQKNLSSFFNVSSWQRFLNFCNKKAHMDVQYHCRDLPLFETLRMYIVRSPESCDDHDHIGDGVPKFGHKGTNLDISAYTLKKV